ncbi:MAG: AAA family ATPase, partial [Deltaproteobacteria bacterium]|nr:AAA family ATPase [Deltaproteobacteria bacterium]
MTQLTGRTETEIHRGRNRRVARVVDPADGPLIIKRSTDDGSSGVFLTVLYNEKRILERLQGASGCPSILRYDANRRELVIKDFGGATLSQAGLLGSVNLQSFLSLSETLARILAAIHERGVVHKDFNPTNILIRLDDLELQIIDFELATTFAEEHPEFDHLNRLLANPAYLSPEQTGRMNRPVDYRTDLYSLGATLYALATGAPPFEEADLLNMVHAHLARSPHPPQDRAPWLPQRVAELILMLLAKEPDDRYQSAAGVAHDLRRLRLALREHGELDAVRLQERDLPISPRPPRRLYGRDNELATLLSTFSNVTGGGVRGIFIAGYSGVGKTALIREIYQPVTLGGGLFISGKFEQFQRDRPILALSQCLQQLCQMLLAEPEDVVEQWRQRIMTGVGPDVGVLFEVAPELEALLGPQATAPLLGPIETQIRLRTLLVALLRQVASPQHPLVVTIDDLQWADQPSLDFIGALLEETKLNGLLLIGAYRDNEVDAAHPLTRLLSMPMVSGARPPVLTLASLTVEHIAAMLADMLRMSPNAVHSLADILFARTGGNPFFTVELLNALYREGVLHPDSEQGVWYWDAASIFAHSASANVVEFLAAELARLADATADALVAAACLGASCTLGLLAQATGYAISELAERLLPALERGIIVTPSALAFHAAEAGAQLRFYHDRMHQAVYQLRDKAWRTGLHLDIARRFTRAEGDAANQLRAAEHYATAASLLTSAPERAIAQRLFLNAALQARQSGAFDVAERFLRLGIEQLAEDAWQSQHDAAFTLHAELHVALYSQSRHAEADDVYAVLALQAEAPLRLVEPAGVQIVSLANRTRYEDAIHLGMELLARLKFELPTEDLARSLEQELDMFYRHVANGALDRMPHSPALVDERLLGAAKILNRIGPAAFFASSHLAGWLHLHLIRLWIESGFCSAALLSGSSLIIATLLYRDDYTTGYRIACVAMATGSARERGVETARTQHVFGLFNSHWFQPLPDSIAYAHDAFDKLLLNGDLEMACFTFFTSQAAILDTCTHLAEMKAENTNALNFARKTKNRHAEPTYIAYRQLVRAFEGKTAMPGSFNDVDFDEQAHLVAAKGNQMALCFFHIHRALAACIFNDDGALLRHAEAAENLTRHIIGFYPTALAKLLHSLALLQQSRTASKAERAVLLKRLDDNQAWLAARAVDAPMNFGYLFDFVEAERLDALDRPWEALQAFEQAMRKAQAQQRLWQYALITEKAGACCMRRGLEHAGRPLLTRACDIFSQWGAEGKARAMRFGFPFIETGRQGSSSRGHWDALDHEALLRASQALASETSQSQLVMRVVEVVGKLTNATDVRLLLLDEQDGWILEGGMRGEERLARMSLAEAEKQGLIAASVLRM